MTFHCEKLCSDACCAPLLWALEHCEDVGEFTVNGDPFPYALASGEVLDPAELAKLLAMALQARGVDARPLKPRDDMCAFAYADEGDATRWMRTMSQARALVLSITSTPPNESSREQAKRLIRDEP